MCSWCEYVDLPGRDGPCLYLNTPDCPCLLPLSLRPCPDPGSCPGSPSSGD